jgi:hypothetical protein
MAKVTANNKTSPHQPIISLTEQQPYLIRAIKRLAQRTQYQSDATQLLHDLSGITAMVADKFTNDRTAEGIQEALRLTIGCISLGLSQAQLQDDDEAAINLLIEHGAERVFQQGFRLVRDLAKLPEVAMLSPFDNTPYEQERQLKSTFLKFCNADPNTFWAGHKKFQRELESRKKTLSVIQCAQWLRKNHHTGAIKEEDMDADGVLAVAVIFAVQGNGEFVARAGQKKFEALIDFVRLTQPDFENSWAAFLKKFPAEHQPVMQERINTIRTTSIIALIQKTIETKPTKTKLAALLKELQNHGGSEVDIDYP